MFILIILIVALFILGMAFVGFGISLQRKYYQRYTFTTVPLSQILEDILPTPLLGASGLVGSAASVPGGHREVKYSLTIKMPHQIRSHKSDEIVIDYYQGKNNLALEGLNTFFYEKLDIMPRVLPNGLRGLFLATSSKEVKPSLKTDLSIKISSPKISVAPEEWIKRIKGTLTPCKWRWGISCDDIGIYNIVVELSDEFQRNLSHSLNGQNQFIFQVEVRSELGVPVWLARLSHRLMGVLGKVGLIISSVAIIFATLLAASPAVQDFVTKLVKPFLPH